MLKNVFNIFHAYFQLSLKPYFTCLFMCVCVCLFSDMCLSLYRWYSFRALHDEHHQHFHFAKVASTTILDFYLLTQRSLAFYALYFFTWYILAFTYPHTACCINLSIWKKIPNKLKNKRNLSNAFVRR